MSIPQNSVRRQGFTVPPGLNRLLLLRRFDFRQKTWGLPAPGIRSGCESISHADSTALASLISKNLPEFSDPSLGGANPSKRSGRRIAIRQSLRRALREPKTAGGKPGRRTENPNLKFSFRNPPPLERAESVSN